MADNKLLQIPGQIDLKTPGKHGDRITMEDYNYNLDTIEVILNWILDHNQSIHSLNNFKGFLLTDPTPANELDWYVNIPQRDIKLFTNGKWVSIGGGALDKDDVLSALGITQTQFDNLLNPKGVIDLQDWHEFNAAIQDPKNDGKLFFIQDMDAHPEYTTGESALVFNINGSQEPKIWKTFSEIKKYIDSQIVLIYNRIEFIDDRIFDLDTKVDTKADKSEITGLDVKISKNTTDIKNNVTAIDSKADVNTTTNAIALKADKSTVKDLETQVNNLKDQVSNVKNTWIPSAQMGEVAISSSNDFDLSALKTPDDKGVMQPGGTKGPFDFTAGKAISVSLRVSLNTFQEYELVIGNAAKDVAIGTGSNEKHFGIHVEADTGKLVIEPVSGITGLDQLKIYEVNEGVPITSDAVDSYTKKVIDDKIDKVIKDVANEYVSKNGDPIDQIQSDLKLKADDTATKAAIALKADIITVTALDTKVTDNANEITTLKTSKADVTSVNAKLLLKADATALDSKSDKATTYTKTEVDGLVNIKMNSSEALTKTQINDALALKGDKTVVDKNTSDITKKADRDWAIQQLDTKADDTATTTALAGKANKGESYTKDEADGLLGNKADTGASYTKSEMDTKLNAKLSSVDLNNYARKDATYSTTEADALLKAKADESEVVLQRDRLALVEEQVAGLENTWTGVSHIVKATTTPDQAGEYDLSALQGDKGPFDFTAGKKLYVKMHFNGVIWDWKRYELKVGDPRQKVALENTTMYIALDNAGKLKITGFVNTLAPSKTLDRMEVIEVEENKKIIAHAVDAYTKVETDSKLALKQDKLTTEQLANVNADHSAYLIAHQDISHKADTTDVNNKVAAVDAKVATNTTVLGTKADKAYVDTQLGTKADKLALQLGLADKADKTYVDTELKKKAAEVDTLADWKEEMVYHSEGTTKYIKYVEKNTKNERQQIEVVAVSMAGVGDILTYQSNLDIYSRLTRPDASFGGTATVDGTTVLTYQNPSVSTKKFGFSITKDQWYKVRYDGTKLYLSTNGSIMIDGHASPAPSGVEMPITAVDFLSNGESNVLIQLPTGAFTEGDVVLELDYTAHLQTYLKFFNQEIQDVSTRMKYISTGAGGGSNTVSTTIAPGATNTQYLFIEKAPAMVSPTEGQEFEWVPISGISSPLGDNTQIYMGDESSGFDPIIVKGNFGDVFQYKELNNKVVDGSKKYIFKYYATAPSGHPQVTAGKPYWDMVAELDNVKFQLALSSAQMTIVNANAYTDAEKSKVASLQSDDTSWKTTKQDALNDNEKQVLAGLPFTQPDKNKLDSAITAHQDISGKADVGASYTKAESDNKYATQAALTTKLDASTYTTDKPKFALKDATNTSLANKLNTSDLAAEIAKLGIATGVLNEFKGVLSAAPTGATHNDLDWYINDTSYTIEVWHDGKWNHIGAATSIDKATILNLLNITEDDVTNVKAIDQPFTQAEKSKLAGTISEVTAEARYAKTAEVSKQITAVQTSVSGKQDALTTAQKSVINSNPFTNTEKTKLDNLADSFSVKDVRDKTSQKKLYDAIDKGGSYIVNVIPSSFMGAAGTQAYPLLGQCVLKDDTHAIVIGFLPNMSESAGVIQPTQAVIYKSEADEHVGGVKIYGDSTKINTDVPTHDFDAANKKYVDSKIVALATDGSGIMTTAAADLKFETKAAANTSHADLTTKINTKAATGASYTKAESDSKYELGTHAAATYQVKGDYATNTALTNGLDGKVAKTDYTADKQTFELKAHATQAYATKTEVANKLTTSNLKVELGKIGVSTDVLGKFKGVSDTAPSGTHVDLEWYINSATSTMEVWHDGKWNSIGKTTTIDKTAITTKLGLTDTDLTRIKAIDQTFTQAEKTKLASAITAHQDISHKAEVGESYTKSESDNKYATKTALGGKASSDLKVQYNSSFKHNLSTMDGSTDGKTLTSKQYVDSKVAAHSVTLPKTLILHFDDGTTETIKVG